MFQKEVKYHMESFYRHFCNTARIFKKFSDPATTPNDCHSPPNSLFVEKMLQTLTYIHTYILLSMFGKSK